MKIMIHSMLKRPWGNETPYTFIDDDGKVYNGFLLKSKITEKDVISEVTKLKEKYSDNLELKEELIARKEELEAELQDLTAKITESKKEEQVVK